MLATAGLGAGGAAVGAAVASGARLGAGAAPQAVATKASTHHEPESPCVRDCIVFFLFHAGTCAKRNRGRPNIALEIHVQEVSGAGLRDETLGVRTITDVPLFKLSARPTWLAALLVLAACSESKDGEKLDPNGLTPGGGAVGGGGSGGSAVAGSLSSGGAAAGTASAEAGAMSTAGSVAVGGGGAAGAMGSSGAGGASIGGGGAGGSSGGAGTAGTGGMAPAEYRFVRLVATSELAGHVWSSVAELQVMTTAGAALARDEWKATADSEELDDQQGPASAAIDGDDATFWHTAWEPAPDDADDAKLPHWLTIDLGSAHAITGFSYLPRQDGANGRIGAWEFHVSVDGEDWGNAVDSGTFAAGATLRTISF
jgi:hypothetical protein